MGKSWAMLRSNRYSRHSGGASQALLRRTLIENDRPIHDMKTGFIQHPVAFPYCIRRMRFWEILQFRNETPSGIGIMFDSSEYLKPGTFIEFSIPLPDRTESFMGKVVLVRSNGEQFEIGLWLYCEEDANRVRLVEQICHIEVYMQEKKYRDGPYNLNPDRVAREWISKYASQVPVPLTAADLQLGR